MKITYNQFKKFEALMELGDSNPEATSMRMIEIFTNRSKEEVRQLSIEELDKILLSINEQLSIKPSLQIRFEYEGEQYGLIPNFSRITTGELIDLDTLLADKDFEGITSILYRKITSENKLGYTVEPYEGKIRQFKELPYETVLGVLDFFTRSFQTLKKHSHTSTK